MDDNSKPLIIKLIELLHSIKDKVLSLIPVFVLILCQIISSVYFSFLFFDLFNLEISNNTFSKLSSVPSFLLL